MREVSFYRGVFALKSELAYILHYIWTRVTNIAAVSGKDLINNHLIFFLYHHVALFNEAQWPCGIRVNGHLMLNGEKMAKSTGNFLTLSEAVEKYGADATRIAFADSGDGIEDANFDETVANATILRLYELRKWCQDVIDNKELRGGDFSLFDKIFDNDLNALTLQTKKFYDDTTYKLALKSGFYDFVSGDESSEMYMVLTRITDCC